MTTDMKLLVLMALTLLFEKPLFGDCVFFKLSEMKHVGDRCELRAGEFLPIQNRFVHISIKISI
jgi:hypothetical protein